MSLIQGLSRSRVRCTVADGSSNVVAYSITRYAPQPYRFKSTTLRFEVPGLGGIARLMPNTKFFRNMRETVTWKGVTNFFLTLRTWSRRTIFGDRASDVSC
jgi:hypothetical protein